MKYNLVFEGGGAKGLVHVGVLHWLKEKNILDQVHSVAGTSAGAIIAALVAADIPPSRIFVREEEPGREKGSVPVFDPVGIKTPTEFFGKNGKTLIKLIKFVKTHYLIVLLAWLALVFLLSKAMLGLFDIPGINHSLISIGNELASFRPGVLTLGTALFLTTLFFDRKKPIHITAVSSIILFAVVLFLIGDLALLFCMTLVILVSILSIWFLLLRPLAIGLVDPSEFTSLFNKILLENLEEKPSDGLVRFKHLNHDLYIVSTNLRRRKMEVFSSLKNPEVLVSEAVAASIAIPFVFKPAVVGNAVYYDGGLVSNLPAWTMEELHTINPDLETIAIEIPDVSNQTNHQKEQLKTGAFDNLLSLVKAAVFGASDLSLRLHGNFYLFPIRPSDVGMLDFDMTRKQAIDAVEDGYYAAKIQMNFRIFELRKMYSEILKIIHQYFIDQLKADNPANSSDVIRLNISAPDSDKNLTTRIRYQYNMAGYTDDNLILPLKDSGIGVAHDLQEPIFHQKINGSFPNSIALNGAHNRYRKKLTWENMNWFLSIPIVAFDDTFPSAEKSQSLKDMILTIDSNIDTNRFQFSEGIENPEESLIVIAEEIQVYLKQEADKVIRDDET